MLARWNRGMYSTICKNQQAIVAAIDPHRDVEKYEWLVSNVGRAENPQYQREYRTFWSMNAAQLNGAFYQTYFNALTTGEPTDRKTLCHVLYDSSTRQDGQKTLQFSFITKLRHMLNPRLPIYDDRVARFYLFQAPSATLPLAERIDGLIIFHDFLAREYRQVLKRGLLSSAIAEFSRRLKSPHHTEEKIIDWLIFGFVGLADKKQIIWRV